MQKVRTLDGPFCLRLPDSRPENVSGPLEGDVGLLAVEAGRNEMGVLLAAWAGAAERAGAHKAAGRVAAAATVAGA